MKPKYEMKVANTYDEAYAIGVKFIEHLGPTKSAPTTTQIQHPTQIQNPMWSQSLDALQNTLKYVMELLHHQCYLLCINNNNILLCKLEPKTTAPIFKEALETSVQNLDSNDTLTRDQVRTIKEAVTNNIDTMRVMQCVVKPIQNAKSQKTNEYLELLKGLQLPNGVFLLNLTDAVILRDDNEVPFPMVVGRMDLGNYTYDKHIPILSISGQKHYLDIPVPNYDDVMLVLKTPSKYAAPKTSYAQNKTKKTNPDPTFTTNWDDKVVRKAVFRGGPTGCGYTAETNMRIRLVMEQSKWIDARFTSREGNETIDSKSIRYDPKYGLGSMKTSIKSDMNSFLSMAEQSKYKYIIHVDGNVNAYRLLTTMTTGSLVLRITSQYTSWADHLLQHMVHYVPVRQDLSDLNEVIQWCNANDDKCQQIAANGMELARSILNKQFIQTYFQSVLWQLSQHYSPTGITKRTTQKAKPKAAKQRTLKQKPATKNDIKKPKKSKEADTGEYIPFPSDKKRCPNGYKTVMVNGVKQCKKQN